MVFKGLGRVLMIFRRLAACALQVRDGVASF